MCATFRINWTLIGAAFVHQSHTNIFKHSTKFSCSRSTIIVIHPVHRRNTSLHITIRKVGTKCLMYLRCQKGLLFPTDRYFIGITSTPSRSPTIIIVADTYPIFIPQSIYRGKIHVIRVKTDPPILSLYKTDIFFQTFRTQIRVRYCSKCIALSTSTPKIFVIANTNIFYTFRP